MLFWAWNGSLEGKIKSWRVKSGLRILIGGLLTEFNRFVISTVNLYEYKFFKIIPCGPSFRAIWIFTLSISDDFLMSEKLSVIIVIILRRNICLFWEAKFLKLPPKNKPKNQPILTSLIADSLNKRFFVHLQGSYEWKAQKNRHTLNSFFCQNFHYIFSFENM